MAAKSIKYLNYCNKNNSLCKIHLKQEECFDSTITQKKTSQEAGNLK